MASQTVEERLETLETRIEMLQRQIENSPLPTQPNPKRGWKAIVGRFADDPLYDEAMRLGREWRESQIDDCDGI